MEPPLERCAFAFNWYGCG